MYKPEFTSWPKSVEPPTVSVVTPVYNEDKPTFDSAMKSWIDNGVTEIIAVIDKTNTHHIVDFERRYGKLKNVRCRAVVTPKPGKRAALCDGIAHASGQIIALVDSDTIWGKDVLKKSLPLFLNRAVGGVTVAQRIQNPDDVSNVMFDILLWTRYREEVPFLLGFGKVFNTLSGRTALYRREALLNPKHDNLHDLRHEFFFKTRGVSGDDKRLTHLILEQGWLVSFAEGAEVYTPGLSSIRKFLKQRLRWTRNSWRADLRAMKRGWVLKHPVLAYFMFDRFIQPLFMLIGPIIFVFALFNQNWTVAGLLFAWWLISRFIKLFGYFKAYPARIIYLPAYILYSYLNAVMKIYAFATLLEHSWATRWHKARMKKKSIKKLIPIVSGSLAVLALCYGLFSYVHDLNNASGASVKTPKDVVVEEFNGDIDFGVSNTPLVPKAPDASVSGNEVKTYIIQPGDQLSNLANKFGMTVSDLKKLNNIRDPDKILPGQTLIYFTNSAGAGSETQ